jgi:uncharacterized OB-fold protein
MPSFDPSVLDTDGGARLLGGSCTRCATLHIPTRAACPACGAAVVPVELPTTGVVYSTAGWPFDLGGVTGPVTVVLVDLPGGIRVQGAATTAVEIGARVRVVPTSMGDITAFAFETVDG